MARWRTATTLVSVTAVLAGVIHLASCSAFSATTDAADAASGADAAGPTDGADSGAPPDAGAPFDAAGCSTSLALDFEDPAFPPASFTILKSTTGGKVTRSGDLGTNKSGALLSELTVPQSGGAFAHILRTFDLPPGPSELRVAYDFTAPTANPIYASVGCELLLRPTSADTPSTDVYFTVTNGDGPQLNISDNPSKGDHQRSAVLEPPGSGFHHAELTVVLGASGTPSTVHGFLGTSPVDLSFTLVPDPTNVVLRCGFYADTTLGAASIVVDNVSFAICPKP